jgi:hypothetical protein
VDFEQVLKAVVWRLVTEGCISYRRIKRSFGLDDDALEDGSRLPLSGAACNSSLDATAISPSLTVGRRLAAQRDPVIADDVDAHG